MTTNTSQQIKPVSKKERIFELDIIRGFALFGVLLVNTIWFNTTFFNIIFGSTILSDPLQVSGILNKVTALFIQLMAEGNFYTIFSFLFGLGFYIFMERAESKGLSSKKLFLRRSFFLFVFGILHFTFVWIGDILHVYGLIGFILIFFKNRQLKTIKRWIIGLLIFSTILNFGFTLLGDLAPQYIGPEAHEAQLASYEMMVNNSTIVYQNGSLMETIGYRLQNEAFYKTFGLLTYIPKILGMFLIGLYVGKKKIFNNLNSNTHLINKTWTIGAIIGGIATVSYMLILFNIIPVSPLFLSATKAAIKEIATIFMSMFYITSIIRLYKSTRFKKYLLPLRYMGQMALTNYLMQCILCSLIFYGHGLGLVDQVSIFMCLLLTIFIYSLQVIFSKHWLSKFKYGPFEWIWRRLTYGKML